MAKRVQPAAVRDVTLRMPGDKSISHRAAMLAGIAEGTSRLTGFLRSEDCLHTLAAVRALGAEVTDDGTEIIIVGCGGQFRPGPDVIDLGNSGTGIRLLAGLLAGQAFASTLTGDASLLSRPMRRVAEPLARMGASIALLGADGRGPIRVGGGTVAAMRHELTVASAQVKSCILLASLYAKGRTTVVELAPTRDHTELMFRGFGLDVEVDGLAVSVEGAGPEGPRLAAGLVEIPGDFSSAAFWLAATAAAAPGTTLCVEGVGLNPRRTAFLDVLRRMGAGVEVTTETAAGSGEAFGTIRVTAAGLRGTEVGGAEIPNLIDELPLLGVLGALAEGETRVGDAAELRVKETDRIAAVVANLRLMGVSAEEREDGFVVQGGATIRGGVRLPSYGDHRISMSGAVLALHADAAVELDDVACVATSYPGFWEDLGRVTQGVSNE